MNDGTDLCLSFYEMQITDAIKIAIIWLTFFTASDAKTLFMRKLFSSSAEFVNPDPAAADRVK